MSRQCHGQCIRMHILVRANIHSVAIHHYSEFALTRSGLPADSGGQNHVSDLSGHAPSSSCAMWPSTFACAPKLDANTASSASSAFNYARAIVSSSSDHVSFRSMCAGACLTPRTHLLCSAGPETLQSTSCRCSGNAIRRIAKRAL